MKKVFIGITLSTFAFCGFAQPESIVESSTTVETGDSSDQAIMFDVMDMVQHSDQGATTPEQLTSASQVVARGYIDSITAGRTIVNTRDLPNTPPLKTSLIKLEVTEILKGDAVRQYLYFEYPSGGIDPSYLQARKYRGEIIIFLSEPGFNKDVYLFYDSPDGLMSEVDKLYGLTLDSSFFIEKPRHVSQPLNNANVVNKRLDTPMNDLNDLELLIVGDEGKPVTPYIPPSVVDEIISALEK